MPYHGVVMPLLRKTRKKLFSDLQWQTESHWQAEVLSLWCQAEFREDRYAALYLAGDKRARIYQTPKVLPITAPA